MKQQTRFYVSRKNPLTWIAAALSLASIVLQILALCLGEGAVISTVNIWFQKVLPMAVSLGFALQLVLEGETRFYRTSKPIFWACVYFGQAALDLHLHGGYALFGYMRYVVMCWILYLLLYLIYRLTITGKIAVSYPLLFTLLVPLAILIYDLAMAGCTIAVWYRLVKISNIAMAGSAVVAVLAMRPFTDGAYHPTWGDRKDGRLIRTLSPMNIVAGYIMPTRNDACNSIQTTFEISKVERYIRQKRAEGMESFGLTHVLLAAYVRCIAKYPGVNRFFSGQRVYQRDDDVQFTMTIKKDMRTDGEETTIKLHLKPTDTTKEVYEKLNALIDEVKNTPLDSTFDHVAALLASMPRLLLKFVVWFLKTLDYFGMLPTFLTDLSPFHGTVIFTSMGSLGIPPIVHHLYNFGNLPVFVAFGRKYRKVELDLQGKPVTRRYVDFVMNTDERIVDGFYYATVMKYFEKLLREPEQLDLSPEEVIRDIP